MIRRRRAERAELGGGERVLGVVLVSGFVEDAVARLDPLPDHDPSGFQSIGSRFGCGWDERFRDVHAVEARSAARSELIGPRQLIAEERVAGLADRYVSFGPAIERRFRDDFASHRRAVERRRSARGPLDRDLVPSDPTVGHAVQLLGRRAQPCLKSQE